MSERANDGVARSAFGAAALTPAVAFCRVVGPDDPAREHRVIVADLLRAPSTAKSQVTPDILDTARAVRTHYRDLELDLADAVNVAVAAEFRTNAILTLDRRDFRAIRPLTDHHAFRLLPDDA